MLSMSRAGVGCVAMLLALAGEAAAQRQQNPNQQGVLAGRVIDDSSGSAIGGAEVHLLAANDRVLHRVVASADGQFTFPIHRRGEYKLRAAGPGFREATTPGLAMNLRDSVGVEVRLRQGEVLLAPLMVVARPARRHLAPGLDNFRHRQESSVGGRFITREAVLARQPMRLTDVLSQAGVAVSGNVIYFPRSRCSPMIYMDGVQMTRPPGAGSYSRTRVPFNPPQSAYDVINLVSPGDVEGIEVYPGRASTPAEFGGPGAECGVIAIWTRRSEQGDGAG
jgi:hypothetical protein